MAFVDETKKKLEDREKRLEKREEALQKALEGVESEKKLMLGRTPKDFLTLNVGGKKILVLREVLCQYEDSLLAAHFSGRWDDSVEKDADGAFLLDHSPEHFEIFLSILRAKSIETPRYPALIKKELWEDNTFMALADHWGMIPYLFQQRVVVHRGLKEQMNCNDHAVLESAGVIRVCTPNLTTFCIRPKNHVLPVKAYEVTLIEGCAQLSVGWADVTNFGSKTYDTQSEHAGVGGDYTIALSQEDMKVFYHIATGGNRITKQGIPIEATLQAGSKITAVRDAHSFVWLGDGVKVGEVKRSDCYHHPDATTFPVVTSRGQWKLTKYEY